MKYQTLFSGKNKNHIISLLEFAQKSATGQEG